MKNKIALSLKNAYCRTARWLRLLFFPPVCRFCGKRQSIFVRTLPQVLCPDCMKGWAQELRALCPTCAAPYFRCRCMPNALQRCETRALVKLAAYRSDCSPVMSSLVLRVKDVPDRAAVRFLATELMMPTFLAWQELGVAPEDTLVTYAPRSLNNLARAGHDQARMLSRTLARALELSWAGLFRRKIGNKQQKQLNASARAANADQSFALRKTARVQGKTVLLLDDICTSGATLSCCARLLYEAGAAHVIAVCVAQTAAASASSRVPPKPREDG